MKKIVLLFTVMLFCCCKNDNTALIQTKEKSEFNTNRVVILIHNKENISTNVGSGINALTFARTNINSEKNIDTIVLEIKDYKRLYIRNDNSMNVVLTQANDTLDINILKNTTTINFLNRSLKKYDSVSLKEVYQLNLKNEIANFNKSFKKYNSTKNNKITPKYEFIKSNIEAYKGLNKLGKIKLDKKIKILNQLYKDNLLSSPNYSNELSNLKYKHFISLIKDYKLTNDDYYLDKIYTQYFKSEFAFNDPFSSYGYLNSFIIHIILKSSVINADYRKAFDKLPDFFEGNQLKLFRNFCLHQIARSKQSSKETINYFEKYMQLYSSDTASINFFNEKYIIDSKRNNYNSKNVELVSKSLQKTNLTEIIKKNKGSVIYVDFWASWCAPCLAEMPSSKILQEDYKNENIVFLYISIDTDKMAWENKNKSLYLKENYSYLALNYPASEFYKKLKIKAIPRYLLFDKNGELVYENAPRPSSLEIKELFNKYLK